MNVADLQALYADEARDISEPAEVMSAALARGSSRSAPNRRRWIAPIAAAAAVAAVVVGGIRLAGTHHKPEAPATHTLPRMGGIELRYTGAIGSVPNYQFKRPVFATDRQITEVSGHFISAIGDVTIYVPGAFDPTKIKDARPVTVGKVHALFGTTMVEVSGPPPKFEPTPTLAWQLSSGRWLVITGWGPSELSLTRSVEHLQLDALTEEKKIAAAVDTSVTRPFLVPFKVGYLPSGLVRDGGEYLTTAGAQIVNVEFRNAAGGARRIEIGAGRNHGTKHPPSTFDLNGHPAWIGPGTQDQPDGTTKDSVDLTVDFGPSLVTISTIGVGRDELIKIGRSVSVAKDVNNPSTWFDAMR